MVEKPILMVLRPVGDRAPAHHLEASSAVLGVVINDRRRIGRRQVPARRDVRRWPFGRNAKGDLDLADIGGKARASTHSAILACSAAGSDSTVSRRGAADLRRGERRTGQRNVCGASNKGRCAVRKGALFLSKLWYDNNRVDIFEIVSLRIG